VSPNQNGGENEEARGHIRQIIARAAMYTYGFLAAGFAVALGGSALVAWFLHRAGMPFLPTWLAISIIVLLPPMLVFVWQAVRDRR
jgi:hypothetical protein